MAANHHKLSMWDIITKFFAILLLVLVFLL